jgi:hypothetical protein
MHVDPKPYTKWGKFRNVNNWSYDSIKGCVKLFTQLIRIRIGTI